MHEKPDYERLYFELAAKVADALELMHAILLQGEQAHLNQADQAAIVQFPLIPRAEE